MIETWRSHLRDFCWRLEKKLKDNGDIILKNYLISGCVLWGFFLVCLGCLSFFINYWRCPLQINLSILFFWRHDIRSWSWWKWQDMLGFLVIVPLFIRCGYHMTSFPWMEVSTLTHVMVRDEVRISRNVKQSWMDPLVLLLDALVKDWWCCGDSTLKTKVFLSGHTCFFYLNMILHFLFILRRVTLGRAYKCSHKE